jgi:polysaccharide export outer membrane protein
MQSLTLTPARTVALVLAMVLLANGCQRGATPRPLDPNNTTDTGAPDATRSPSPSTTGGPFPEATPRVAVSPPTPGSLRYRIQPLDSLIVTVYGHADLGFTGSVPPDGGIRFPLVGEIAVANRTLEEVRDAIQAALADGFLTNPFVTVRITGYAGGRVSIMGAVGSTATFPVGGPEPLTMIQLLSQAGGFKPSAQTDRILIFRANPESGGTDVIRWSYRDPTSETGFSADIALAPGDRVLVPEAGGVEVIGEVGKPGFIALSGARENRFMSVIATAGGFGQWADTSAVRLYRPKAGGGFTMTVINAQAILDATDSTTFERLNVFVEDGDVIVVPD